MEKASKKDTLMAIDILAAHPNINEILDIYTDASDY